MAAATSILHRANEAVAKEQRLAAVVELQNRVEDWKGHQIDHFGDLMLFGTFTVLKGEGAKEVEREVREIFFSLTPTCRTQIRQAAAQDWSPSHLSSPERSPFPLDWRPTPMVNLDLDLKEYTNPNLYTVGRLDPNPWTQAVLDQNLISPKTRVDPCPKRFASGLEGVPEHTHEGHSADLLKETSLNDSLGNLGDVRIDMPDGCSPALCEKFSKPPLYAKSSLGCSPSPLQSPDTAPLVSPCYPNSPRLSFPSRRSSGSGGSSPPTPSFSSREIATGKLSDMGSKVRTSKQKFKAVFKKTQSIQVTDLAVCPCLHLFNGPFMRGNHFLTPRMGHLPPPFKSGQAPNKDLPGKQETTDIERDRIEVLKLTHPVRIQYKVYLFERILLCCKEVNPNKPKNKMLGNTRPLVDKRGKLRLQLKGRIFMQNVTDVVSVNRSGTYGSRHCIWQFY